MLGFKDTTYILFTTRYAPVENMARAGEQCGWVWKKTNWGERILDR